jgi:DNA-binding transcriptional regulator YhcF (GntR family)
VSGNSRRAATIAVDPNRPVPPYEQVRQQIADLITGGGLEVGTRLPPVRQLAADLGLANGTVARAYQELEAAGLVETRRGGGTIVAESAVLSQAGRRRLLTEQADRYAAAARRLGVTDDEALDAVRTALAKA